MYQRFVEKFNNISFTIILGICTLLPILFLPAQVSSLTAVKGVVLYAGVLIAFSCWLVAQFINGSIQIPRHKVLFTLVALIICSLVSAFASVNTKLSLWGRGFVLDSFITILILSLFTFLIANYAREQKRLVKLFLGAFAGSVFTILLQVLLYVTSATSFVATHFAHVANNGTLVGSWIDFAYFVTFTFILSLLMTEVLLPRGFFKVLSFGAVILSLLVLVFLNFKAAWIIAIISALLTFVYKFSVERSIIAKMQDGEVGEDLPKQGFPIVSFISLLVGLFFFLSTSSIGASISRYAGIVFTDFRPSFSSTTHIMRATLLTDPVFGAGAGRFSDMWNLYRPQTINNTIFWNTPFDSGYNLIESLATTQGSLVAALIIVLFVLGLGMGFRLFSYNFPDTFSRFIAVTAFIMFIAFVGLFFLASPGMILVIFGFMYLGLLLGVSVLSGRTQVVSFQFLNDPRLSFFTILIMVVLVMAGFTATYLVGSRYASVVYFNRALAAPDFDRAISRIDRALSFSQNDIYLRTRTALFVSNFNQLASASDPDKNKLQQTFSQAEQSALAAVQWDPGTAGNWLVLSQVYQLLAGSSEDAYANAVKAAKETQTRNPFSPVAVLNEAQIEAAKKNNSTAIMLADKAISLKSDYLDAYTFKAALKISSGDTSGARTELTNYTKVSPYDPQGYLLLGGYYLGQKQYESALESYRTALTLSPNDPSIYIQYISALNASGNKTQAIKELENFKTRFPSIEGVDEQIERLRRGESAATPVTPTVSPSTVTQ
jgi:tetratricopeptide (TPR) repeat protein